MTLQITAYTDLARVAKATRKNLNPILDFHFSGMEPPAIEAGRSNPASPIRLTRDPTEADYFILPLHWTCYLWNGKREMPSALKMAELADRHGKKVIIWFKGDLVPRMPFNNYILFLPGLVRSKQKKNHIACPVFVDDPQPTFGMRNGLVRSKTEIPTVGFCGYAASNAAKTAWSVVNGLRLKTIERLGLGDFEEVPVLPSTFLRSRVLSSLSKSRCVRTNFLTRQNYTPTKPGGLAAGDDVRVSEFFTNIYDTDYTVCVRGYGNWSYRFYQTLACGRIPVFVDTDCALPESESIDWKKYCVWVAGDELDRIGEKISLFHDSISEREFFAVQNECRNLWRRFLTPSGFFGHLSDALGQTMFPDRRKVSSAPPQLDRIEGKWRPE